MLGVGEQRVFITIWGDLRLEVIGSATRSPPSASEHALIDQALFWLRHGIEAGDGAALEAAGWLESALHGCEDAGSPRAPSETATAFRALGWHLEQAVRSGFVRLSVLSERSHTTRREEPLLEKLSLLPQPRESAQTFFELRLMDEVGQAVSGIPVEFAVAGAVHEVRTNAAGVALLDNAQSSSAVATVPELEPLEKTLEPRWQKPRRGKPPKEGNTTEVVFEGAPLPPMRLKAALPNNLVLKPPLGQLFLEVWDKSGRARHAGAAYEIQGPETFAGQTDENGQLRHAPVFAGDYSLKLTLTFVSGEETRTDVHESPLVVLPSTSQRPELRMLGAVPLSVMARLRLFFDTNKTFLLPTALPGLRRLRQLYLQNDPSELLVVGHADTAGSSEYNERLSLARAESVIAFLEDDVDAWLKNYDAGVPAEQRWGRAEDRMMLLSLPDIEDKPPGQDAVRWFQTTRQLEVDGKAGPRTRRKLIGEYMGLDGASLSELGFDITATAHGCGEHFPLDDSGEGLDAAPADEKPDALDRRVELFFFDPEFGIFPAPPGKISAAGSSHYPAWRKSAIVEHVLSADPAAGLHVKFVELVDALFRTNSAVVLPEGEAPNDGGEHEALKSVGIVATALRFNAEQPGKKLLIAGHTDTTASAEFNQALSEERARCALSLLIGGDEQRGIFARLCHARHTVRDYKQILSWVSRAFPDLVFDCDPGVIDDDASTGVAPVRRFQQAYNVNKAALGATAADLVADGALGPLTWGAIYDCYELALQHELGEDRAGVRELREKLVFVDEQRRALGFSEHFPIEGLGVDNYRSETNRRVEILFFDDGEEPDLEHAEHDPASTELYLPGLYSRLPVPVRTTDELRPGTLRIFLLNEDYQRMPATEYELRLLGEVREGVSDEQGLVTEPDVVPAGSCELLWSLVRSPGPPDPELPIEQRFADPEPEFRFRTVLELKGIDFAPDSELQREAELRLSNLGYLQRPFAERYGQFRRDYERPPVQRIDRLGFEDLAAVHRKGLEAPLRAQKELDPEAEPQLTEADEGLAAPLAFELRLADGAPARGAKFVVSSGGAVLREGQLDEAGQASITDLGPDTYTVSFPELDAEAVTREA